MNSLKWSTFFNRTNIYVTVVVDPRKGLIFSPI